MQHSSFSIWLISFSIMPLKSIHVVFFFCVWLNNTLSHISHFDYPFLSWQTHRLFPHRTVVTNAAADMWMQASFWDSDLLDFSCIPRSGIAASFGISVFNLSWGNSILFSIVAAQTYVPTNSAWGSPSLHISRLALSCLTNARYPSRCEEIPHYGFDFYFPDC